MGKTEWEYFARCASGFEQVLARELKELGMRRVRPLRGGVAFFGGIEAGYRACLWSRVATRIQLVLARIGARDANELYANVRSFAWESHLPPHATIALEAHGTNKSLRKTTFTALKAKDALCDRMREVRGKRPDVDAKHPDFAVNIALHETKATLYLNLSGESLHRRGYREDGVQTEAPLKETLAAGILLMAGWPALWNAGGSLIDPMCGSGTFAIEAALIASNTAPGLARQKWGFFGWAQHDPDLWASLCSQAQAARQGGSGRPRIVASDIDGQAIAIAKANAQRAGVLDMAQFRVTDAAQAGKRLRNMAQHASGGLLVANPPYGRRLMDRSELPGAYAALATCMASVPSAWEAALITPDPGIDSSLGRIPYHTTPCFNGPIETTIRQYRLESSPTTINVTSLEGRQQSVPVADEKSAQFAARLRKVARERARWAKREGIDCYRIYDADLPDYALSVDLFQNTFEASRARYARIVERRRPASVDHEAAVRHLADARNVTAALLGIPPADIAVCAWEHSGNAHAAGEQRTITVSEDGLRFQIALDGDRTPALPLNQRSIRRWVGEQAEGKRVACLFASGGAALLHAAANGARTTIAVDPSKGHVDALRQSFSANGFSGKRYRFESAGIESWIGREVRAGHTYDLVVCIPPSWLPARDAGGHEWDLGRDAASLLGQTCDLLSRDGQILFVSTGEQRVDLSGLDACDMSSRMTPEDFERSIDRLHCWRITRGPDSRS